MISGQSVTYYSTWLKVAGKITFDIVIRLEFEKKYLWISTFGRILIDCSTISINLRLRRAINSLLKKLEALKDESGLYSLFRRKVHIKTTLENIAENSSQKLAGFNSINVNGLLNDVCKT